MMSLRREKEELVQGATAQDNSVFGVMLVAIAIPRLGGEARLLKTERRGGKRV